MAIAESPTQGGAAGVLAGVRLECCPEGRDRFADGSVKQGFS